MNIKTSDYSTVLYQKLCNNYVKTEIKNTNIAKENEILRYAAAAAKSLQSCLTLSNPMDYSLSGSSIHGIFQARVLEWGAIAFSILRYKSSKI